MELKKSIKWSVLVIAVAVAICGIIYFFKPNIQKKEKNINARVAKVITLEKGNYTTNLVLYGNVKVANKYKVNTNLNTKIAKIFVHEGEYVKKGQTLMKYRKEDLVRAINILKKSININEMKIQKVKYELDLRIELLKNGEENRSNADNLLRRNKKLFEKRIISKQNYEKSLQNRSLTNIQYLRELINNSNLKYQLNELKLENDKLHHELDDLEKDLKESVVKSPVDGYVEKINYSNDHDLSKQDEIMIIIPINQYEVHATIPYQYMNQKSAEMFSVAYVYINGGKIRLPFSHFAPTSEQSNYGRNIVFNVPNDESKYFYENQSIVTSLQLPATNNSYRVTVNAIYYNDYVYLVDSNNQLVLTKIKKIGYQYGKEDTVIIKFDKEPPYKKILTSKFPDAVNGMIIAPIGN